MITKDNKIVQSVDYNPLNDYVTLNVIADKYAKNVEKRLYYIGLLDEQTKPALNAIAINRLIEMEELTSEVDVWHEADWNYRVFIRDEDMRTILSTPACAPLVLALFSNDINPCYKLSEGCLFYLNSKDQNMIDLLSSIDITIDIEDKF